MGLSDQNLHLLVIDQGRLSLRSRLTNISPIPARVSIVLKLNHYLFIMQKLKSFWSKIAAFYILLLAGIDLILYQWVYNATTTSSGLIKFVDIALSLCLGAAFIIGVMIIYQKQYLEDNSRIKKSFFIITSFLSLILIIITAYQITVALIVMSGWSTPSI
jgi:hypothetical protein